jgi:hypothetical protein
MPQAAAAPPQPSETPEAPLYRGDPDAPPGTPDWLIARAVRLEQERARIQEQVGANRRTLRDLDAQDALNDEQAEFLDVWYPEKERGERRAKEDIEATRKAREAARKNGTAK